MDFSAANTGLWNTIVQFGIIAGAILFSNVLRRKLKPIRNTMIPTAVLGGFLLLLLRSTGVLTLDTNLLEMITYHCIALGFIAMSLRVPEKLLQLEKKHHTAFKSGALIVSTYLLQGICGLLITLGLCSTIMPDLFPASGLLLPMGYGQGPGQANNVGTTYEALGFTGGRSFGLAIAAAGYLCACIAGVIIVNVIAKKRGIQRLKDGLPISGSVTVDTFQSRDEIPIAESVDRLSVQIALVLLVYLGTYLLTWGITSLLERYLPGLSATVSTLIWGFNFILGSVLAMALRAVFGHLRKARFMTHQYQNNYLLSRISGLAFDYMIVAGIASIDIGDLSGLWLPFLLMTVLGALLTLVYLSFMCKRIYGDYYYEGLVSMYGMLTGTISSGVLLLRELDPKLETPAANNLILGSSFAIVLGAPMLLLISLASKSASMTVVSLGFITVYLALLVVLIFALGRKKKNKMN